jgi:uncharacterized protein
MQTVEQQTALKEIVRRIIDTAHPQKIILFGSAARGEMGPHSDFDLLVVVPDGVHRRKTAMAIYRKLFGICYPIDIVVATEGDCTRNSDNPGLVFKTAMAEGEIVYAA